jgi:hypothetical protein
MIMNRAMASSWLGAASRQIGANQIAKGSMIVRMVAASLYPVERCCFSGAAGVAWAAEASALGLVTVT